MSTAEERFWAKVNKTETCWLWTSAVGSNGYGMFSLCGKAVLAHRFAYELLVAPIPKGLQLDHLCRVSLCVRPAHLEPVTNRENTRRGRAPQVNAARQLAKAHCPAGHPYSGENLRLRSDGRRECLACRRTQGREYQRRRRARMAA